EVGGECRDARGDGALTGLGDEPAAHLDHNSPGADQVAALVAHRSFARWAAMSRTRSDRPAPVAAEIAWKARPRARQNSSRARRRSSVSDRSLLLAATICGRRASSSE